MPPPTTRPSSRRTIRSRQLVRSRPTDRGPGGRPVSARLLARGIGSVELVRGGDVYRLCPSASGGCPLNSETTRRTEVDSPAASDPILTVASKQTSRWQVTGTLTSHHEGHRGRESEDTPVAQGHCSGRPSLTRYWAGSSSNSSSSRRANRAACSALASLSIQRPLLSCAGSQNRRPLPCTGSTWIR